MKVCLSKVLRTSLTSYPFSVMLVLCPEALPIIQRRLLGDRGSIVRSMIRVGPPSREVFTSPVLTSTIYNCVKASNKLCVCYYHPTQVPKR